MKLESLLNENSANGLINTLNRNGVEAGIHDDVGADEGGIPYVQNQNGDEITSIGDYAVAQSNSGPIVYINDDGTVGVRFIEKNGNGQPINAKYRSSILRWELF